MGLTPPADRHQAELERSAAGIYFPKRELQYVSSIQPKQTGTNIILTSIDHVINWGRKSSIWFMMYGIACCAIEMATSASTRYDMERYGVLPRATPRQSDLMIVAGPVVKKMVPVIRTLYEQMAEPRYVIAMGCCAISGGLFKESYNVLNGADRVVPVDIYIPGCHPRCEALMDGIGELQKKIMTDHPTANVVPNLKKMLGIGSKDR